MVSDHITDHHYFGFSFNQDIFPEYSTGEDESSTGLPNKNLNLPYLILRGRRLPPSAEASSGPNARPELTLTLLEPLGFF